MPQRRSVKPLWVQYWDIGSHSDPSKTYKVSLKRDGTYACDCGAWKFHPKPKVDCKHIDEVKSSQLDVAQPALAVPPGPAKPRTDLYIVRTARAVSFD
jgi:hypothetical protein